MIFNCGPRGSGSSSGIDFGGKFNPLNNIIFPTSFVKDTDYKIIVDNNLKKWELALLTSGTLEIKNSKDTNLVDIFLIGAGEDGQFRKKSNGEVLAGYGGAGGAGGKYINEKSIPLLNGNYSFVIGDYNNNVTSFSLSNKLNSNQSLNEQSLGGAGGSEYGQTGPEENCDGKNGQPGVYAFGAINNSLLYPICQFGAGGGGGAQGDYGYYYKGQDEQTAVLQSWSHMGTVGEGGLTGGGKGGKLPCAEN